MRAWAGLLMNESVIQAIGSLIHFDLKVIFLRGERELGTCCVANEPTPLVAKMFFATTSHEHVIFHLDHMCPGMQLLRCIVLLTLLC